VRNVPRGILGSQGLTFARDALTTASSADTMFIPGNYMALLDWLIIVCCFGIGGLAFNKSRVRATSANRIAFIGMIGGLIGVGNLLLDSHWIIPPVKTLMALFVLIYLAGASKGVLLGLLWSLVLFKQLRPMGGNFNAEADAS
jgi:hypothetical protein